jgi:DNA-binding HxlR family transcriptional regulator
VGYSLTVQFKATSGVGRGSGYWQALRDGNLTFTGRALNGSNMADSESGPDADAGGCLAGWCADDDFCELTCAAAVVGKKWHPVIVHRLLEHGPMGFNRLKERIDDISATVLSDSLEDLQDNDVVDRTVVNTQPFRVEYSLTARGADLEPVVEALETWGRRHLGSDAAC